MDKRLETCYVKMLYTTQFDIALANANIAQNKLHIKELKKIEKELTKRIKSVK